MQVVEVFPNPVALVQNDEAPVSEMDELMDSFINKFLEREDKGVNPSEEERRKIRLALYEATSAELNKLNMNDPSLPSYNIKPRDGSSSSSLSVMNCRLIHPVTDPFIIDENDTIGSRIFGKKFASNIEKFRLCIRSFVNPFSYAFQIIACLGSFKSLHYFPLWTVHLFWIPFPLMIMNAVLPLQTEICWQLLNRFEILYQIVLIKVSMVFFGILCNDERISLSIAYALSLIIFLFGDALNEAAKKR